jgi:hypothetical protein
MQLQGLVVLVVLVPPVQLFGGLLRPPAALAEPPQRFKSIAAVALLEVLMEQVGLVEAPHPKRGLLVRGLVAVIL